MEIKSLEKVKLRQENKVVISGCDEISKGSDCNWS